MSPLKVVDGVQAACLDPVDGEAGAAQEEFLVEQQWEDLAPHPGTQLSGPFNKLDMELTSGIISTVDNVIDSSQLIMDPSATSTVDLADLFPDLTDLLAATTAEEAPSPLATEGQEAAELKFCPCPDEAKVEVVVIGAGRREQLPSTSSCASGSEMSDYEEGLTPAEVDSSLEHFFNTFTDIRSLLAEIPAEETSPAATVDAAAVRSLIDGTTTENGSSLSYLTTVENGTLAFSAVSASKRVKSEECEGEEETTCEISAKPKKMPRREATEAAPTEDAYRKRRMKNNLACKRARQTRKKRDSDLSTIAEALEIENALLRAKIEELTEIAEISRKALLNVLVQ